MTGRTSLNRNNICPICRKKAEWEGNPFRPFCSERCRTIDLGTWASEGYRIPGEKQDIPGEEEREKNGSDK